VRRRYEVKKGLYFISSSLAIPLGKRKIYVCGIALGVWQNENFYSITIEKNRHLSAIPCKIT
jgi:hypothetical protein